jgi:hypothetical protein
MGGTNARIAASALAVYGLLSLAAPAQARAGSVLDDAAQAVAPVTQAVDTTARPALDPVVSNVPGPAKVPPPVERETPAKGNGRDTAPVAPVRPGPRSAQLAARAGATVPVARDARPARPRFRAETARPFPPHGRKELPLARSHRERAAGAGAARRPHPAALRPSRPPRHAPGLAAVSRTIETWSAAVPSALLLVATAASIPFFLRRLRIRAPVAPRPALMTAPGPPG